MLDTLTAEEARNIRPIMDEEELNDILGKIRITAKQKDLSPSIFVDNMPREIRKELVRRGFKVEEDHYYGWFISW